MKIVRTWDAGCCMHQGAIKIGWRIFIFGYTISICPTRKRPDCGCGGRI
jgi:hypothetical protein